MENKTKLAHTGNYSRGRSQPVKYIVVHYTGNLGDIAQNNAVFFSRKAVSPKRSAHLYNIIIYVLIIMLTLLLCKIYFSNKA